MSSGSSALQAFIAGVESLRTMNEQVAKVAEPGVAAVARASAAAGEAPDGEAWPARKEGGKALPGAAAAITSSSKGSRIELKIGAPYVFHNHGAGGHSESKEAVRHRKRSASEHAKSGTSSKFHAPRRQILPDPGEPIPAEMNDAIQAAAARVFGRAVG